MAALLQGNTCDDDLTIIVASYRLSPAEAATAASQVELTRPPLPHLCSDCSPPASHTSAGYVLQLQADLIYHVTNSTNIDGYTMTLWTFWGKQNTNANTFRIELLIYHVNDVLKPVYDIKSHVSVVNVVNVPLNCQSRFLAFFFFF